MKNLFGEEVDQLPGAHEGRRLRIKNDDPFTPKKNDYDRRADHRPRPRVCGVHGPV